MSFCAVCVCVCLLCVIAALEFAIATFLLIHGDFYRSACFVMSRFGCVLCLLGNVFFLVGPD